MNERRAWFALAAVVLLVVAIIMVGRFIEGESPTASIASQSATQPIQRQAGMVRIAGGRFAMGNDRGPLDAEPVHEVTLDPFWLDEHEVTNAHFARFVEATLYITSAEQVGRATVFDRRLKNWKLVAGADWRHPEGQQSTITGSDALPVVQVSWHDAQAYAHWAGKRLPSEAEWEFAARAGLHEADYPWGRDERIGGRCLANYWQGRFPQGDSGDDGYRGLAPVGSYGASRWGLYDMAGNVAEWCADYYQADYYWLSPQRNPPGAHQGPQRCLRGGSWLSAEQTDRGHTVWARDKLPSSSCNNYTGFRCARDAQ